MKRLQIVFAPLVAAALCGADWLQFRGTDNTGAAGSAPLPPQEFTVQTKDTTAKNVVWSIDLPVRGVSSPIVVGDRIVVTGVTGARQDRLHVLCYSKLDGSLKWHRQFWATGRTLCHPTSSVAAPTPASDGKRIVAFYSSNDLFSLDLDGNLQWLRGLTLENPAAANDVGMAASPLLIDGVAVVQVESKGDSFAAGIDAATGKTLWRVARTADMNWTSPALFQPEGSRAMVLLQSPDKLTAHDLKTGEELWSYQAKCDGISSPVAKQDLILVPSEGITALRSGAGSANWEKLWQESGLATGSPSAVVHDGRVYVLNRAGVLSCGDAKSGEVLWKARAKGPYWATPLAVGDLLYLVNQDGAAHVVKTSAKSGKIVSTMEFGEPVLASPAYSDGSLYFRGEKHLWRIGAP